MNKVIQLGGSAAFIPTFENAAYGIEWTKDDWRIYVKNRKENVKPQT